MTALYWILALVAVQRLAELVHAKRNTARLLARGGVESGKGHYPFIVVLHAAWLVSMALLIPSETPPYWSLIGVYVALQGARYWTIRSLGANWTTRIIRVPGEPLVKSGPYRYVRHPNYLVVAAEIAVLPLAFGAWEIAAVFFLLNAAVLTVRIRIEDAALRTS